MYLSTVGILVITVIFLGLLFLFTPWLYRPYLDLLEARDALEDPATSAASSEAVERLEKRVQAEWDQARQEVLNQASEQRLNARGEAQGRIDAAKVAISETATAEEAELESTIASARTALKDDSQIDLESEINSKFQFMFYLLFRRYDTNVDSLLDKGLSYLALWSTLQCFSDNLSMLLYLSIASGFALSKSMTICTIHFGRWG